MKTSKDKSNPKRILQKYEALLEQVSDQKKRELLADLFQTVERLGGDDISIADLKLFRRSMAEMRYATKVFADYKNYRKVAVFGSARTNPDAGEYRVAVEFSKKMVDAGFMIITGGGDGIMGAAQKGAGAEKSFGLNIRLPFEQKANETIEGDPKLINFNYFFTRKLNFIKETHALVLLPGGFGTQDEGFESLTLMQTGKSQIVPVVLLDKINGHYWETWRRFLDNDLLAAGLISESDFHLFKIVSDADEAVQEIRNFYKVFHSYRWVREKMVIRTERKLTRKAVGELNAKFGELILAESIQQSGPLPEEKEDRELQDKPRLVLTPAKKDFGLFRLLIDSINHSETE